LVVSLAALGCQQAEEPSGTWTLAKASSDLVPDPETQRRISKALDAAAGAGTDPSISHFHVRAGTVVDDGGVERAIVGGNSEWFGYPEAIHGETSLMNHVITAVGPEAARREVDFLAFYKDGECGGGGSCGDCRDYLMTTTRWEDLLMVCGQASDHTVHVQRFADWVVPETDFPAVGPEAVDLLPGQLDRLVLAALEARRGGVSLFTSAEEHLGVAALTFSGEIYRAAGADDAAFHYRYPIGAALQQAASHSDYFISTVVVVGQPGTTPRISYRDRQYGYEASSFNSGRGRPPIRLIVVELPGIGSEEQRPRLRMTTFEEALPGAFSAASFMPDAVDSFLDERADQP
jgi:cytidine deaminase